MDTSGPRACHQARRWCCWGQMLLLGLSLACPLLGIGRLGITLETSPCTDDTPPMSHTARAQWLFTHLHELLSSGCTASGSYPNRPPPAVMFPPQASLLTHTHRSEAHLPFNAADSTGLHQREPSASCLPCRPCAARNTH